MDGSKSIKTFKVPTSHGHVLHVEESGSKNGLPVLFLHGGPGAGIGQNYQWPFANGNFRLIAFDQRGCGKSQPFGSLQHNNTQLLIEDIELLREYFDIDTWLVFGGSWGSTLALTYAIKYADRVKALILRGIFLGRQEDSNWFISSTNGASQVFPVEYQKFRDQFEGPDEMLCEWYFKQLCASDEETRHNAAQRWFDWEGSISKLESGEQSASDYASNQQIYSLALYECFYILNRCFLPQNYILENCSVISDIPVHIVHGRYDMVCKTEAAVSLHKALPNSTLTIVEKAGHSVTEEGISKALKQILDSFENKI